MSATKLLGETDRLDSVALGEPLTKATVAVMLADPATAVMVFVSAFVDDSAVVARPLASVLAVGVTTTSLPLLLLKDTDCEGTGLP